MTHSFERHPLIQGQEILLQKTKYIVAAHSKNFEILDVAVLIQCQGVTDRRTEEQTDRHLDDG